MCVLWARVCTCQFFGPRVQFSQCVIFTQKHARREGARSLTHTIKIHYDQLVFHRTPKWNSPGYWWEDKPSERRPGIDNTINGRICTQSIQMSRGEWYTERGEEEVWCERSVLTSASSAYNKTTAIFFCLVFVQPFMLSVQEHTVNIQQCKPASLPFCVPLRLLKHNMLLLCSGALWLSQHAMGEGVSSITTLHCWFSFLFYFFAVNKPSLIPKKQE